MTKNLDCYFDFGSPASYLAFTQLPALIAQTGAKVIFKPILLGGVFQATGNQSPATIPAKGKYTLTDFARFAKRYGVPLATNPHFPINTLLLMRAAMGLHMTDDARFVPYCNTIYQAIWVDALYMSDPAVVGQVLTAAGLDAASIVALANAQNTKDALKAATEAAVARGVFGAPTFFVDEQMFWGQDRIDFVREALAT